MERDDQRMLHDFTRKILSKAQGMPMRELDSSQLKAAAEHGLLMGMIVHKPGRRYQLAAGFKDSEVARTLWVVAQMAKDTTTVTLFRSGWNIIGLDNSYRKPIFAGKIVMK